MPDVNVAYSQNTSLSAKAFVDNVADKIKSGVGNISEAAKSAAGTASAKVKSFFTPNDVKGSAKGASGTAPQKVMEDKRPLGPLEYPAQMKYYALFSFKEYSRGFALSTPKDKPTAQIILPIPSNLSETFGVDYDTPALGPIVGALAGGTLAGQRQAQDFAGGEEKAQKTIANMAGPILGAAGMSAISAVSEKVAPGSGEKANAIASIAAGVAPNPHLAVVLRNVGLREHSFSYRLAPNSAAELAKVKEIIRQLKLRMLPGVTEGADALFTYPDVCDISFATGTMESYRIKRCVLKNLSVNYAPNGPAFFKSGDPVIVEIAMTFMEMSVFTRGDVGKESTKALPPETPAAPPSP
jgi:hypothetical protein